MPTSGVTMQSLLRVVSETSGLPRFGSDHPPRHNQTAPDLEQRHRSLPVNDSMDWPAGHEQPTVASYQTSSSNTGASASVVRFPPGEFEIFSTRCTIIKNRMPQTCKAVVTPGFLLIRTNSIGGVVKGDQLNFHLRTLVMEKRSLRKLGSGIRVSTHSSSSAGLPERPRKALLVFVREADADRFFSVLEKAASRAIQRQGEEAKVAELYRRRVQQQQDADLAAAAAAAVREVDGSRPKAAAAAAARGVEGSLTLARAKTWSGVGDRQRCEDVREVETLRVEERRDQDSATAEQTEVLDFRGPSPMTLATTTTLCLVLLFIRIVLRQQAHELQRLRLELHRVPADDIAFVLASSKSPFLRVSSVPSTGPTRPASDRSQAPGGTIRARNEENRAPSSAAAAICGCGTFNTETRECPEKKVHLEMVSNYVRTQLGEYVWSRAVARNWDVADPRILALMDPSHPSYGDVRKELDL